MNYTRISMTVFYSTFGGISLCLGVLLQLQVAGGAVAVQDSFLCSVVTQL